MGYRIGSFNMYKFSFQSDDEIKKDISLIAKIILNEKFDIVALQEVFTPGAAERLVRELGLGWEKCWDSPKVGRGYSKSTQEAEGFAFLWNSRTIGLSWSIAANGRRIAKPHIYNQYRIDRGAGQQELARNPYYARFKPNNCSCEIRLINVHLRYSKDAASGLSAAVMRKNEFDILTTSIFQKISDKRYGNNMPSYTIILGDYNLNLKRDWTTAPYVDEIVEIKDNGNVKRIKTVQHELTSLKMNTDSEGKGEVRGYANNYDHFSYDEERCGDIRTVTKRIDTVRKYCQDDFAKHRKVISDHVPIMLAMDLRA